MKQNHIVQKEEPQKEVLRESRHKVAGFGRVGLIGVLGLGVALGLVLGFFLFNKSMKVVVEIEPKASPSSTSASVASTDSKNLVTRDEMVERFEQEIGEGEGEDQRVYQSTCLIEVRPIRAVDSIYGSSGMPIGPMTKRFIKTQFAIIMAPATLELAMDKIQLVQRWGKDRKEVLKILQKIVSVKSRRGTDLIEISVGHQEKESAQMICKAVYQSYIQRRRDFEIGIRKDQLKAIKMELQNKSDRVAELRQRLMNISEKSGVVYADGKVIESKKEGGGDVTARDVQEFNAARKEYQTALAIKDNMEVLYDREKTKMVMPVTNVIVHEEPSIQEVRSK